MLDTTRTEIQLVSGCAAVAQGAWEAGVEFVASYPGSPVTGIVDKITRFPEITYQWSANEKVALETAAGAAYSGSRALAIMKHVGLNVAADPLFNIAYTGIEGALVIVVGDDPGAQCSQNEQDTRHLAWAANVPVLEPANVAEMSAFTKLAFEISEEFDVPVIVRVTTQLCYSSDSIVTSYRHTRIYDKDFAKPLNKYLLLPAFVPNRHRSLLDNLSRITNSVWPEWFSQISTPTNSINKHSFGIICSGHTYSVVKEFFSDDVAIMKLGMVFPMSKDVLARFFNCCEKVIVAEEGSGYLDAYIRSLGFQTAQKKNYNAVGTFSIQDLATDDIPQIQQYLDKKKEKRGKTHSLIKFPMEWMLERKPSTDDGSIQAPSRPPGFCAGCSHTGIFYTLKKLGVYVVGDIGCYTLGATEPFNALHANLCMGAGIGIHQGYLASMGNDASNKVVSVIGDSTFFHSGIPSLLSAIASNRAATILILDNNGTAMTGYQMTNRPLSFQDWSNLLSGLGVAEYEVLPALDIDLIEQKLTHSLESDNLSVLVLKGDCVQGLPRKGPTNYRYTINTDLCTQCGTCLDTDCPSIVTTALKNKQKLFQISNECIGCGLCSQVCPEKAIIPRTVDTKFTPLLKVISKVPWHKVIRNLRRNSLMRKIFDSFEKEYY